MGAAVALRRLLLPAAVACAAAAACAWTQLTGFTWTDYEYLDLAPMHALMRGDWAGFFEKSPIEGPSLLLRAPFALAVHLWGGGDLAVYRMMAVPGLLAAAVLGVTLWALRTRRHPGAAWPLLFVALAAGNPIALRALAIGHPEALVGGALCVGAVLAALGGRPWWAAVLLGLALANKAWAVVAIGPVLLALDRRRLPALVLAGAVAAVFVAPFLLAGAASRAAVTSAGNTNGVFQPWQIWWFAGAHGHPVIGWDGLAKVDWRAAPGWIAPVTHPLIAVLVVPLSGLWWWLRRDERRSVDLLLLLALLLLLRCVLDVADNAYYHLPFLLALLAWEALARGRPPVWSLLAVCLLWVTVVKLPAVVSPDVQSLAYLAWVLPAVALLARATFRPRAAAALRTAAPPVPVPVAA